MKQLRKKNTPSQPFRDVDLVNYYEAKRFEPTDENKDYVVGFSPHDGERFVLVWSTPKLVAIQAHSEFLATDATYKLNW